MTVICQFNIIMEIVACFKIPTFDHVINNIYLGDITAANDPNCLKTIDIIINISNSRYEQASNIEYHHFDLEDNRNADISQFFDKFIAIVNDSNDRHILVHCMNGVSRSVTLVLYYLMTIGMKLSDASQYLKSKRKQNTRPNIGFFKQLLSIEKQLYESNSMTIKDFIK